MAAKVLVTGLGVLYWCPGCRTNHSIKTPYWSFDGNVERPTFSPSILVDYGDGRTCHSFVKGGRIEYLPDCYHALKSQTVPMEDFDHGSV